MKTPEKIAYPITYLISDGTLTDENFAKRKTKIIETLKAAIIAGISMFQIREKQLSAKSLLTLTREAVKIAEGSPMRIIVNDRSDIAVAAGAAGVQLTETSLAADAVRRSFPGLLIGVSTHSAESIIMAARAGADFALFGPVFETPGKSNSQGLDRLRQACDAVAGFPIVAIGGIDRSNIRQICKAGARGFASIRFLNSQDNLKAVAGLMAETSQ